METTTATATFPEPEDARDPLEIFREWYAAAEGSAMEFPESACLSTATSAGVPSSRMVFLRGFDERGFVFFTNYASRKAKEMEANPHAAMLLYWPTLQRQVRVEGTVARVAAPESEAYFASRHRGSQVGAWASRQSDELSAREDLERRFAEADLRYQGRGVPLPPFWGGYRIAPLVMEFWQARANRLHDRLRFERATLADLWRASRLYP